MGKSLLGVMKSTLPTQRNFGKSHVGEMWDLEVSAANIEEGKISIVTLKLSYLLNSRSALGWLLI